MEPGFSPGRPRLKPSSMAHCFAGLKPGASTAPISKHYLPIAFENRASKGTRGEKGLPAGSCHRGRTADPSATPAKAGSEGDDNLNGFSIRNCQHEAGNLK